MPKPEEGNLRGKPWRVFTGWPTPPIMKQLSLWPESASVDWRGYSGGLPLRLLLAFPILTAITCVFFLPLFRGETFTEVATRQNEIYPWAYNRESFPDTLHFDQVDSFYPRQVFINKALRSGEFPLWNPDSFAGQPFHATQPNGGLLYPFRAILSLTVPPERVHDLLIASHMLIGGLTMFVLLASGRLSFAASLFGATAWMVNSFALAWMALDYYPPIHAWLPLGFLIVWKMIQRPSMGLGIGAAYVLAIMSLGGNLLFIQLSFVALAGFAVYMLVRGAREHVGRDSTKTVASYLRPVVTVVSIGLLVFVGLVAAQLLPTIDLLRSVGRTPLTYLELQSYRLDAADLIHFFIQPTEEIRHLRSLSYESDPYHRMLFLGAPTPVLVLFGFFARHPLATYVRWLFVVVLAVVLGTPAAWVIYKLLPGFDHFKPLGRALFLFNFAAAALGAFGLDLALQWARRGLARIKRDALSQAGRIVLIVLAGSLVVIVVAQMYKVGNWVLRHQPAEQRFLFPSTPLVNALGAGRRILPIYPAFYGSTAMLFDLHSATGYNQMVPSRTMHLWRVVQGYSPDQAVEEPLIWAFSPVFALERISGAAVPGNEAPNLRPRLDLLGRLGIQMIVTPPRFRHAEEPEGTHQMYAGPDGSIYVVRDSLPPAYLSPNCEVMDDPRTALRRLADPSFDPLQGVILETDDLGRSGATQPLSPGQGGSVAVTRRSLNTLTLHVASIGENWLVVNECWDPGWTAEIDGRPAPVIPANYAFRAVRVPPGTHTVKMWYRPLSFVLGRAISLLTLFVTLVLAFVLLRKAARSRRAPSG